MRQPRNAQCIQGSVFLRIRKIHKKKRSKSATKIRKKKRKKEQIASRFVKFIKKKRKKSLKKQNCGL